MEINLEIFFGKSGWDENPVLESELKSPLIEVGRLQTMFSNPVEKYVLYKDAEGSNLILQKYHRSLGQHGGEVEYYKYFKPLN